MSRSGNFWLAAHVCPYLRKVQTTCRIPPLSEKLQQYKKSQQQRNKLSATLLALQNALIFIQKMPARILQGRIFSQFLGDIN